MRVKGMPIRVKCNTTIEGERCDGQKIEEGKEIDIYSQYSLEYMLSKYPGCVTEVEMTEQDWVELATREAKILGKAIENLKDQGLTFKSYHIRVVPEYEDEMVDGTAYGGGLPDAYSHLRRLKEDVEEMSKRPGLRKTVEEALERATNEQLLEELNKNSSKSVEPQEDYEDGYSNLDNNDLSEDEPDYTENDELDKLDGWTEPYTGEFSIDELEIMLQEELNANQKKQEELNKIKYEREKEILIQKIKAAQAEGKKLDQEIALAKENNREVR